MTRAFCAGETLAKTPAVSASSAKELVVHRFDFGAKHDAIDFESNLAANLAGDDFIVAGENLDRDT